MRWIFSVSPPHGNGRDAETLSPPGSSATVIESAGTPGSATCTSTASALSTMSAGGSHAEAVWWKNWRCRRSARSSIDRASLHIQVEISRDLTAARWRRNRLNQARCKKRSELRTASVISRRKSGRFRNRGASLFLTCLAEQPPAECHHRGPLRNDLRTYKVIGRLRRERDLE